jgi:hypothetical protein
VRSACRRRARFMRSDRRFAECARRVMRPARRRDAISASDDVERRLCCLRRHDRGRNHPGPARAAFRARIGMNLPPFVGNMRFDPRNRGCSAADRTRFVAGSDRILLVVVWSTHAELHSSDIFQRVRGRRKVSWIYLKTAHSPGAARSTPQCAFVTTKSRQIGRALTGRTCAGC